MIRNSDQTHQYGRLIRDEGRRLTDLVEQVLMFSGLQNGIRSFSMQLCNLQLLIKGVIEESAEEGVAYDLRFDDRMPEINCDPDSIRMVLRNILSNARKYATGYVHIRVSTDFDQNEESAIIAICDNGIGIPAGDIGKIFNPFYRAPSAVEAQIQGTGLGLSLAWKIIDMHHGRISVRSEPGRGSCFEIRLPVKSGEL